MKFRAELKTDSEDAKSVARALDVDNVKQENLKIKTKVSGKKILTTVESDSINTLISTLDDVIMCQRVAEKSIRS
jgi:hypothetical protein